jgi:hypothetical protein
MIASDYTISNLATLMANELPDDTLLGFTAAGLVLRNRVLAGWDGADWLVLNSKHDRYSANPPSVPRVLKLGDPHRDVMFRRVLAIAESIYIGRERDTTEGALYYGHLNDCSEKFKTDIVRQMVSHPMVATIGGQAFFR